MYAKKFIYVTVALFAAALLWGCGSSGSGGSAVSPRTGPDVLEDETSCFGCHAEGAMYYAHNPDNPIWVGTDAEKLVGTVDNLYEIIHSCQDCHGGGAAHSGTRGSLPHPRPTIATCAECHVNEAVDSDYHNFVNNFGNDVLQCTACHNPLLAELIPTERTVFDAVSSMNVLQESIVCIECHTSRTDDFIASNPFADEITERYEDGRHTGRARDSAGFGNCAGCHSHEGAVLLLSQSEKINTIGQVDAIWDDFAALGEDLNVKTCATCHDPHTGDLRGLGDVTEVISAASTSTGPAERVVFSAEYNLCTSCHQANVDYEFVDDIGYSEGGMFVYSLSDAYLHANDPYGDPSNVGYHSNSYQDRSFFDTHFSGLISKDLYYYDISDKEANGYSGVDKARRDRRGDLIVTDDMTDAIAMLEAYYQEYLAAPDDIQVNGYGVNPGSPYACSSCHDVHSANKIEGTADLIKADADGAVGHVLMSEPSMQQAIAYGEGVGMTHNNYISDAFSRERIGCTPCHTGREFVSLTVGGEPESARWNTVGCISCHDMVDTEDVVLTEARTFQLDYEFAFNSEETVDVALLGTNQVCFECHKGRTPGVDVATLDEGPTNHYDISYLHYSPTFATHYGTDSGMVAEYAGKDYRGKSTTHGGVSCLDCHDVHMGIKESNPIIRDGTTCITCHGDDWSQRAAKGNVSGLAGLLIDVVYDELMVTTNTGFNANLTAFLTALQNEADPSVAKDTIKSRIKERTIDGGWPTKELAHAVTTWKVFYYEDKASWAHNRNYTYQMLHDAIESIGGEDGASAATEIVARPAPL